MFFFLRFLAICYFIGFIVHCLDLVGLRLNFALMSPVWKTWTLALLIADFFAGYGLWHGKKWGLPVMLGIAISQLIVYVGFRDVFGPQNFLIGFHLMTLLILGGYWTRARRP